MRLRKNREKTSAASTKGDMKACAAVLGLQIRSKESTLGFRFPILIPARLSYTRGGYGTITARSRRKSAAPSPGVPGD
jgi:hypothetical protein